MFARLTRSPFTEIDFFSMAVTQPTHGDWSCFRHSTSSESATFFCPSSLEKQTTEIISNTERHTLSQVKSKHKTIERIAVGVAMIFVDRSEEAHF